MVLHVVLGRVREHDLGLNLAHDRRNPAEKLVLIVDLEVVDEARMVGGADDFGGIARLAPAQANDLLLSVRGGAAIAIANREDVRLVAGIGESGEGAGHHELHIVGMRADS